LPPCRVVFCRFPFVHYLLVSGGRLLFNGGDVESNTSVDNDGL
jgi:hypothetical protein